MMIVCRLQCQSNERIGTKELQTHQKKIWRDANDIFVTVNGRSMEKKLLKNAKSVLNIDPIWLIKELIPAEQHQLIHAHFALHTFSSWFFFFEFYFAKSN